MRLSIVAGLALLAIAAPARAGAAGCAVRAAPATSEKTCAERAAGAARAGAAPVARLRVAPAAANASDTLPLWLLPAGAAALVAVAFLARRGARA
jgi:hypothetical protein